MKKMFHEPMFRIVVLSLILGFSAKASLAASVYNCTQDMRSCVIKVEDGVVGDKVRIMDSKARKIAEGMIQKRKGSYAIVKITDSKQTILKGYPATVEMEAEGASLQWAASFSFQE